MRRSIISREMPRPIASSDRPSFLCLQSEPDPPRRLEASKKRRVRAALVLVLVFFWQGCDRHPFAPLPDGAVPFSPPATYFTWWQQVELCSGLNADFTAVSWYIVPNVSTFPSEIGDLHGSYQQASNSIIVAGGYKDDPLLVRHEELHAILRQPGHPPEYFEDRCKNYVYR